MFEDVKELFEEDYNQYRLAMDEMHLHNVCVDASKYINEYGIDMFLKRLVTYVDNPAQSMLVQRCVEYMNEEQNRELRNTKTAKWIRLNMDLNDAEL